MKAIVVTEFGGPEVLKQEDLPDPKPGPGEVLVRVRAAGVNPVETYIRSGKYPVLPAPPYTPGAEGAGEVVSLGEGIAAGSVPERVFLSGSLTGTYAEYTLCKPEQLHPLPSGASFAQGAAMGIAYATAWRALFIRGAVRPGETVLVHGASGGVGTAAVQLAHAAGLRVLGTAGSEEGLRLVRGAGAEHVFHHGDAVYRQAILDVTDGRGVDCILEMLANVNLGEDLKLLAPHGRVVVVGSRGTVEINPRDLMMREADIRGLIGGLATSEERRTTFEALGRDLAAGRIAPIIAREFPLSQAAEAHRQVMEGNSAGKIVLAI
jgi:NADPH:quinone reductase and related Zn-dependent oxidoreductases